jgi:hypothetical protein
MKNIYGSVTVVQMSQSLTHEVCILDEFAAGEKRVPRKNIRLGNGLGHEIGRRWSEASLRSREDCTEDVGVTFDGGLGKLYNHYINVVGVIYPRALHRSLYSTTVLYPHIRSKAWTLYHLVSSILYNS